MRPQKPTEWRDRGRAFSRRLGALAGKPLLAQPNGLLIG
jgi:hypothetical protein